MHLYIGYKRYSSWSLRPWLAMKFFAVPFEETLLPFSHDDSLIKLSQQWHIPATVPILKSRDIIIWDSLSIFEFLAEQHPNKNLWPKDPSLRCMARSASAEMHSGFFALRNEHPMNCQRIAKAKASDAVQTELDRLADIWSQFAILRQEKQISGPFLCGKFSLVDAMFAPVAWRCKGYSLEVSELFLRWQEAMISLPEMQLWYEQGKAESWRMEKTESIACER